MEPSTPRPAFRLDDWFVEPDLDRVSRGSTVHHMRPRLMDLLVYLAEHAGQVVTKDQILDAVWRRQFVAESVLSRSVADLRQLLGDQAGSPRYIETVTKRGYRVVAAVSREPDRAASAPVFASIAVLPFVDMAPEHDQEYLCDGLAEELTNGLAHSGGLRVVARTSAFAFKGKAIDVREISRQLNVRAVLEGGVQRAGDRLRITVQLIDGSDGYHIWSRHYDCVGRDVFSIEDEIVEAVAGELRARLTGGPGEVPVLQGRTSNPDAHDLYLRGRHLSARRSPDALKGAVRCFERALEIDPQYAEALAASGECHCTGAFLGYWPPGEAFPTGAAAARRALAIAPDLSEAHAVLGHEVGMYEWRWADAEHHFRRALELNPNSSVTRMWYSHLLDALGRVDEAVAECERGCECDPLSPVAHMGLGVALYFAGRHDLAVSRFQKVLETSPRFTLAHFQLGRTLLHLGRLEEAAHHLAEAGPDFPMALGFLASAWTGLGRPDSARDVLAQLDRLAATRYVGPIAYASVYTGTGNRERLLYWTRRAFDDHDGIVPLLAHDPLTSGSRDDPAFRALYDRLNLPSSSA